MADSPLIDIFDLCVERLAAGETVEDCLRDYPEYANELRGLLETGFLVFQAQADPADEQQAQAHTRSRIEQALQTDFAPHRGRNNMPTDLDTEKPKNRPFTIRRSVIWIGASAAAVFMFTLGFAFATSGSQPVGVIAADADYSLNATAFVLEATAIANAAYPDQDRDGLSDIREAELGTDPIAADTDGDRLEDGDEIFVWNTVPTLRDTDNDSLLDGEEVNTYGTNPLRMDTDGDGKGDGNEIENRRDPLLDEFILTATQYVAEITQTAAFAGIEGSVAESSKADADRALTQAAAAYTATPLPSATRQFELPTLAPDGTIVPPLNPAGGDTAIMGEVAATSVALYLPMTATPVGMAYNEAEAGSAEGRTDPAEPPASVVDGDTTTLGREASSDEFKVVDGVDSIVPYGGPAITLDATFMPGTTSSDVLAGGITPDMGGILAPPNMQQQLDPMKAGEIDDNAEWDTYTEFRRNYISSYGTWTILDYDISGRRIIKVVDAIGNPILGAHVEVFMDQVKVSDSYTYATGMTLFFPNALESTKRRDLYEVVVSTDQYQTLYTLDLRSVGDVLEIQLPIVIIRAPQPPNAPNIANDAAAAQNAAAAENATAAALNAQAANQNATAASENATAASRNATAAAADSATLIYIVGTATALPTFTPTPATR